MKTILSNQTVDIPDNGKLADACYLVCFLSNMWGCILFTMSTVLFLNGSFLSAVFSRGEAEGQDGHRQGTPWHPPQGVQPHQPGAQPAGQEEQEGERCFCSSTLGSTLTDLKEASPACVK